MRLWIWLVAALLYGAFVFWYDNWDGPLTRTEIQAYLASASPDLEPEQLASLRAFMESDDGGEFFMLNLIAVSDGLVSVGSATPRPAADVLSSYTDHFMPRLLARAGHPAFAGPPAGAYIESWGVEPDPGWTTAAVIRYRSRRDLIELATDPAFASAHAYKIAAMASTFAIPLGPAIQFFGPRVWVGLTLALLAALANLVSLRRRLKRVAAEPPAKKAPVRVPDLLGSAGPS